MADAVPILEMRSITKEFPAVKALSDVSITVGAGEIHAICGENGAGKSTLMKVLSGVYPHGTYSGEIWFRGPSVALGYWNAPEVNATAFDQTLSDGSAGWMRTGERGDELRAALSAAASEPPIKPNPTMATRASLKGNSMAAA